VLQNTFQAISLVWSILRKFWPEELTNDVRGMRSFKDATGAVFDIPSDKAGRFFETFTYIKEERRGVDFEVTKCKELPELRDDDRAPQGQGGNGYGGGYGGGGGYGQSSYGSGGYGGRS